MTTRTYRTRTCSCGREVKRLNRTEEGPLCGDCMRDKGLKRLPAPVYRSRAVRLAESVQAVEVALEGDSAADIGEIEDLAEEMASWRDNMEAGGLENTPKFEEVSECADALEQGKDSLESAIEEWNGKLDETFGGPQCSYCGGECDEGEVEAPEAEPEKKPADKPDEDDEEKPENVCPEDCEHCRGEGLEEFREQVREALGELESVDFPGMY